MQSRSTPKFIRRRANAAAWLLLALACAAVPVGACNRGSSEAAAARAAGAADVAESQRRRAAEAALSQTAASPSGHGSARVSAASARAGTAATVRALTGARTRVVWVESDRNDPYAVGNSLVLMGLDTDDGKGERVILGERGSYGKPMLISRGARIVYNSHPGKELADVITYVVNWDGTGRRELARGAALAVWEETANGRDWVYVGTDNSSKDPGNFHTVTRFPVDDPAARQLVWNKTLVSGDTFQVSGDGRTAGGLFPWPNAGIARLPNGDLRIWGEGCWTAFRDAGAGLFWYFDGSHRNVIMVDQARDRKWTVPLNRAPGFENPEVYHPRWANHPRFVAISGPYNRGGPNQVRTGGTQAEIYLGRFSQDYSRIEAWARATENNAGDSYPDVWIDRGRSPHAVEIAGTETRKPDRAPAKAPVVVEARLSTAATIPAPRSIAPYRNALVVNIYDVIKVVEGEYRTPRILVAQWAIRDARVLDEARQRSVGSVARLTLERYDAHPELEGERLIAGNVPDLPLYYDLSSRR